MMKQGTSSDFAAQQALDWRQLFVALPANLMVLDTQGKVLAVSRSACTEIGCEPKELLGESVLRLIPDRFREKFQGEFSQVLGPDPSGFLERSFRIRTLRHKGDEISTRIRISPYQIEGDSLLLVRFSDITEFEKQEKALKYSEDLLRTLFELAPLGISLKDLETGRFLLVNPALEEAIGYSKEELLGLRFWEITPKEHWEEEWELFSRVEEEGSIGPYEKEYYHKDGHRFPVLLNSRLIEDLSGHKLVWSIIVDISDRVQLEKERSEMARRLEEARRFESLALMAGSMSHQFNNLLTAVLASLEFAAEELPPDSLVLDLFQEATRAAWKASQLINQMLIYSGKSMGSFVNLDLSVLVLEKMDSLVEEFGSEVQWELELTANRPFIQGDPEQLTQLLQHLFRNSVEATEEGPVQIQIAISQVQLGVTQIDDLINGTVLTPGPHLLLDFRDQGPGLPAKLHRRAFDPFVTTKAPGRGLGLSAVLGIVRAHMAAIKIGTVESRGCSVQVYFPLPDRELET